MNKLALLSLSLLAPATAFWAHAQPAQKEIDLSKPFDHGTHLATLIKGGDRKLSCRDCHAVDTPSEGAAKSDYLVCKDTRAPFPTHEKCTGCHAKAFFTKPLVICTNCHVKASFEEQADMKAQTGDQAPLRTNFSHNLHLAADQRVKKRFEGGKDCSFCHAFTDGGKRVEKPAHAQCCECHTEPRVEPNMTDCAGCHSRPRSDRSPRSKVRKFSHADHKTDPVSGGALDCMRCHFEVPKAKQVSTLQLPKMDTCVECHQGEVAFDYAECLRCHGAGIEKKPVPADHKKAVERAKKPKDAGLE